MGFSSKLPEFLAGKAVPSRGRLEINRQVLLTFGSEMGRNVTFLTATMTDRYYWHLVH